jgi:hypothetical protein
MKCLYLALMGLDPGGKGRGRWSNRWKAALNAFDITFDGRLSAGRNLTTRTEVTPFKLTDPFWTTRCVRSADGGPAGIPKGPDR